MDIGSSFTYMFQDKDWIKKILIGGVVGFIPIVNFAAIGYMIQIIRNVREGQTLPLPEWDEFGKYFVDGLWIFLIFLVWAIPIIVVACLSGVEIGHVGIQVILRDAHVTTLAVHEFANPQDLYRLPLSLLRQLHEQKLPTHWPPPPILHPLRRPRSA